MLLHGDATGLMMVMLWWLTASLLWMNGWLAELFIDCYTN
jgi:hypothetical protein